VEPADIVKNAFAMPLTSPSFARGPYRYTNREYLVITYRTDRAAIEQNFHDIKEVHGAGKQQLRNYWANIAAYHLTMWLHTLIELWAWKKPRRELSDRSASPWDDPTRRPSHADRRNALRRQCLKNEFQHAEAAGTIPRKIHHLWQRLLKLVA